MSTAAALINNASNASNAAEAPTPVERRCENSDCNASKLLSMVPKRKTQQFVTDPNVMEKPLLINGFTTVFQVDGGSAKLSDLKNVPSANSTTPKFVYRIVPNTHAHIVNYVVVDAEGESLRKINESDPATMRKLLESQKVSADQMLKKLIAGVSVPVGVSATGATTVGPAVAAGGGGGVANGGVGVGVGSGAVSPAVPIITTNSQTKTTSILAPKLSTAPTSPLAAKPGASVPVPLPVLLPVQTISPPPPSLTLQNAQIQLPIRMHPNLKITAVASADTVPAMKPVPPTPPQLSAQGTAAPSMASPTVPLITPVPLSALQCPPPPPVLKPKRQSLAPMSVPQQQPSGSIVDAVDKPVFDKMQEELQELRRTVALLAEAQAKTNLTQQQALSPSLSASIPAQIVPVQLQQVPMPILPRPPSTGTVPIIANKVTTPGALIRGGKRLRLN